MGAEKELTADRPKKGVLLDVVEGANRLAGPGVVNPSHTVMHRHGLKIITVRTNS